jgi:hypothetical protein
MKRIIYTFIALFITVGSFAQEKSAYTKSLEKLMEAKNGSAVFESILESTIKNVETAKQADFKQKVELSAASIKAKAIQYFTKKYSQKDINEIYTEFTTEGRIDYTPKTLTFIREWRNFKNQYQKEFKEIYSKL